MQDSIVKQTGSLVKQSIVDLGWGIENDKKCVYSNYKSLLSRQKLHVYTELVKLRETLMGLLVDLFIFKPPNDEIPALISSIRI